MQAKLTLEPRISRARDGLAGMDLDAVLATGRPAVNYLTGLEAEGFERLIALLVVEDRSILIVPALEAQAAEEQTSGIEIRVWDDGMDPLELVAGSIQELGLDYGRLGVEEDALPLGRADRIKQLLPNLAIVHAGPLIGGSRLCKDESELAQVRTSAGILAGAFQRAFLEAREGMSEVEIQALLEFEIKRQGGKNVISLVQVGERAALPHGSSGSRVLREGDILLIDAATTSAGYWADVTRCAVLGSPSNELEKLWQIVAEAHAAGIAAIRPGARAREVDRAARSVIEGHGYGDAFIHRTGHGLGLQVHERPYLSSTSDDILAAGMVVTVEPGIYLPGSTGVRLEDDLLVTEEGVEIVTDLPRQLFVL